MKYRLLILLIPAVFFLSGNANAQLTGISPDSSDYGQWLTTTITGNGIFIQGSSPNGNIYDLSLKQGSYEMVIAYPFNYSSVFVIDNNTIQAEVWIPYGAPSGLYDLHFTTTDPWDPWAGPIQSYVLNDAFTVNPADGNISGNVFRDLNRNGVKDTGEPGLQNINVSLTPSTFSSFTNASGDYNFALYNGAYQVALYSSGSDRLYTTNGINVYGVIVNNNNHPGKNFALNGAMVSITPSYVVKGDTSVHIITADRPIFRPTFGAQGNITEFIVFSSPVFSANPATNIVRIDSFTVQITLVTPTWVVDSPAVDIRIYLANGDVGFHYLRKGLSILSSPPCVPPDSTFATFVTASSFRTNWTPVPGAFRYQIFYKVGGTPAWTQRSVAGNKTFMGIQNLNCGTNYRWKVRTVCQTPSGNIKSAWTPVHVTTTLACAANSEDRNMITDDSGFDIYPNPANNIITIDPNIGIDTDTQFEVYNLTGARLIVSTADQIKDDGTIELDVSSLSPGMYFVRIAGQSNYSSKFIIQRF